MRVRAIAGLEVERVSGGAPWRRSGGASRAELASGMEGSTGRYSHYYYYYYIAVHRAFVLGLGARHRGIVELSKGS